MSTVQAISSNNRRGIIDSNLSSTLNFGSAGSTVTSAAFDLGDNTDGFFPEHVELIITTPALPNLAAPGVATALTFTVLADTAASPTIALPLIYSLAGTAGGSAAASSISLRIPGYVARFLAVQVAAGANAGNSSALQWTVSLGF